MQRGGWWLASIPRIAWFACLAWLACLGWIEPAHAGPRDLTTVAQHGARVAMQTQAAARPVRAQAQAEIGSAIAPQGDAGATSAAGDGTEARVAEARVWLTIYRGGEPLPDGTRVARNAARVEGVVEYRLRAPATAGQQLVLLNFAEAVDHDPIELDEVEIATVIDGPFRPGAIVLTGLWGVEARTRTGARRDVVLTLTPGVDRVTLRYTVQVPHRYWPFGCVRHQCSLSGAIAPLPSVPAQGGRWLPSGRVIDPVRWHVERAVLATPGHVSPGGGLPKVRGPTDGHDRDEATDAMHEAGAEDASPSDALPVLRARRPDEVVVVGDDARPRQYPSVFWGPKWHRSRTIHRGVTVEVLHPFARPMGQVPHETRIQLRRDVPGQVLQIGTEAIDLLEALGRPVAPDHDLVVVQGPLRVDVAQPHPDVIVLSDQALELLPADRFLKFHHIAIARAMFDVIAERRFRGKHDPSVDLWLPGMLAFSLTNLWQAAREHADEYASDILRNFTFVPAVDRFLYTQQASFSQSYFRGVEDEIRLRNHPLWFSHALPTGRRLHEKLRDTAGEAAVDGLYRELMAEPGRDPVRAAERAYGHTLGWFFDQWLGPYPSVDYLIERVHSERVSTEAAGTGAGAGAGAAAATGTEDDAMHEYDARWEHRITVERVGPQPVIEPVQVLVVERGGREHYLVWNGELAEHNEGLHTEPRQGTHTWTLRTERPIRTVRLDPRSRLHQQPQPPHDNVDPRFNDRRPPSFRFLYTGLGLSIAASEFFNANTPAARFNAVAGFASFEASLRRDLRRTGHLRVNRDREAAAGVGTSVNLWFGKKVNNQRRRSRVRVFTSGSLLNQSSLDERGGVRVIERVSLIDDTRRFGWWPEQGHWLSASIAGRHTMRIDGMPGDVHDLDIIGAWVQLWRLAHDHVLATSLTGEWIVPLHGRSEFRNLSRVGGIGGLSGYLADEIFGQAVALAQVEYRHVYVNDLHVPLVHLGYLRSIGGTLFTGAGSASPCEGLSGWFGPESWYGHAGYSVDARLSIFGVTPQLFRIDVSVPMVRRATTCLDERLPDHLGERQGLSPQQVQQLLPPFNVNVTFQQSF